MKGEDRFNKVPFWQVWRYPCLLDSLVNFITRWGNKVLDSHKFDITLPKMFVIIFTRHSKRREQRNTQVWLNKLTWWWTGQNFPTTIPKLESHRHYQPLTQMQISILSWAPLQLWTSKAYQLVISVGSWWICKIFSESCSDFQKKSKTHPLKFFPQLVSNCQFFGVKNCKYMSAKCMWPVSHENVLRWVKNHI